MTITVYSQPSCVQCVATYRELDRLGLAYEVVDLSQDDAAMDMVRGLGYRQAPVVMASADDHWAGFRPDRLAQLVASLKQAA